MKKLLNKIRRKQTEEGSNRITSDTIAEHREQVLAGGRRFKYPLQYARHHLVITAILIGVGVIALLGGIGYWQLYGAQNTSDFMYRVTRVLPVPVATVDGYAVRYSDYLTKYRSSIHYLVEKEQLNLATEDGQRQSDFVKQQEMANAVADAYAEKLAKELDITVSDAELETFLKAQRSSPDGEISQVTYDAVILDYYGWSPEEYRHAMTKKLLRQKVAYAVDEQATTTSEAVAALITGGNTNLGDVRSKINANSAYSDVTYVKQGSVPLGNQDGGLSTVAESLSKGQISGAVKSTTGDGYYFVKLIDKNSTSVNYEYIKVSLTALTAQLTEVIENDGIEYFIVVPDVTTTEE